MLHMFVANWAVSLMPDVFLCVHSAFARRRISATRSGTVSGWPTPGQRCCWNERQNANDGNWRSSKQTRTAACRTSSTRTRNSWIKRCTPTLPPLPTSCSSTPPRDKERRPHEAVTCLDARVLSTTRHLPLMNFYLFIFNPFHSSKQRRKK